MKKRRIEVQRLFNLGRVSEVDTLKITNSLDDAEQSLTDLTNIQPSLQLNLGRAVGKDEKLKTEDINEIKKIVENIRKSIKSMKLEINRKDLKALEYQIEAKEDMIDAINYEYIPKVSLEGRVYQQDPAPFRDDTWTAIAVVAKWDIFAGGTRQSRKAIERAGAIKLKRKSLELKRSIDVELLKASGDLKAREGEIDMRQANFKRAVKVVKIEAERYQRGKSTLNEILDAEDLLKTLREKKDLVYLEYLKSYFDLQYSYGKELSL